MGTFLEEVLKRNAARMELEPELASRVSGSLRRAQAEALKKLETLRPFTDPATGKLFDTTAARFAAQAVVTDINRMVEANFLGLGKELADIKAQSFAGGVADVAESLEVATGKHVKLGGSMRQAFLEAGEAAAKRPVLSLGNKTSWDALSAAQRVEYKNIFTDAVINGESINKTAQRIKETGDWTRAQATRIARTNMTAAQNDGHRAFYEANPDIYAGYRWEATLDARTSVMCAMLHGTYYPLGSTPPGPPAHPNCRCVLIGVLKDELGEEQQEQERRARILDDEGRAVNPDTGRLYGTELLPAADTNSYSRWLRTQPTAVVNRMLGSKLKGELFRAQIITLDDIVGPDLGLRSNKAVLLRALARNPDSQRLRDMAVKVMPGFDLSKVVEADLARSDLKAIKAANFTVGVREDMRPKYRAQIERAMQKRTEARETAIAARDVAQRQGAKIKKAQDAQKADDPRKDFVSVDPRAAKACTTDLQGIVEAENNARFRNLSVGVPGGVAKVKAEVLGEVEKHLAKSELCIRVRSGKLNAILADGRLKTQFETKTSGGLLNNATRADEEGRLFGLAQNVDVKERPIYGYIDGKDGLYATKRDGVAGYGDVVLKIKSSVRPRTTVMAQDSLGCSTAAPVPLNKPNTNMLDDLQVSDVFKQSKNKFGYSMEDIMHGYFEAQVHGGVSMADVDEVVFVFRGSAGTPDKAATAALDKLKIKWRVVVKQ